LEPRENELVIILADISGYTKFMMANQMSAVHGQICITHLIETLLSEVDIPLHLQEIEGDAVFLYAENPGDADQWQDVLAEIRRKLLRFFEVFYGAIQTSREATPCHCAICAHADDLHLKIVVHSGRAVFHQIGGRPQVSGPDVILAHRLLKNSVPDDEYLLMSEAAYRDLGQKMERAFVPGREKYEAIGDVATYVHFLNEDVERVREQLYSAEPEEFQRRVSGYFSAIVKNQRRALWKHLTSPVHPAGVFSRIGFAAMLLVMTPIRRSRFREASERKLQKRRAEFFPSKN